MSFDHYEMERRSQEMREINPLQIEVRILGRILEGRGQIKSSLEDRQLPEIAEALKQCAALIQEPDSSSCGDGRQIIHLASGRPARLRPRKFGAALSPFNMRALADPGFLHRLGEASSAEELYEACDQTSIAIGNKPAGHVGCGANGGVIMHNYSVAEMGVDSPNGQATISVAQAIVGPGLSGQAAADYLASIKPQAATFAEIMDKNGWNGADYVDRLAKQDGDSVEILQADDTPLHGHKEEFSVLVISDTDDDGRPLAGLDKAQVKKHIGLEYFGVDLTELARDATRLGKDKDSQNRHLVAGLAHHIGGVAYNLADSSLPVILMRIHKS